MNMRRYLYLIFCMMAIGLFCCSCKNKTKEVKSIPSQKSENKEKGAENNTTDVNISEADLEKGYNLPVSDQENEEAERDSFQIMEEISHIYKCADKGASLNDVLDENSIRKMVKKIKKQGYSVRTYEEYSNMENYKIVDSFLKEAQEGNMGSIAIYEVHSDGSIGREKYIYDGENMFLLNSCASWDDNNKTSMTFVSYTRLKEWRYSKKGWFCYELCVPEYPEVTEMVDGNHTKKIDFNGLYEYLYAMKYKKKFNGKKYPNGIPKEQFEQLIMEYMPVSAEEIQKYAVYNKKKKAYDWMRLGCFNYAPNFFGTSIPEVTNVKHNLDGTITLTVDAVCEMVLCNEAVITHELTVKFAKDGSFKYLGNKILNNGIEEIPTYQYRICKG